MYSGQPCGKDWIGREPIQVTNCAQMLGGFLKLRGSWRADQILQDAQVVPQGEGPQEREEERVGSAGGAGGAPTPSMIAVVGAQLPEDGVAASQGKGGSAKVGLEGNAFGRGEGNVDAAKVVHVRASGRSGAAGLGRRRRRLRRATQGSAAGSSTQGATY